MISRMLVATAMVVAALIGASSTATTQQGRAYMGETWQQNQTRQFWQNKQQQANQERQARYNLCITNCLNRSRPICDYQARMCYPDPNARGICQRQCLG